MAIDLGAVNAAAKSTAPKTATTSKTGGDGDSDFSRTLATSRAARDHNDHTQHSGKSVPGDTTGHEAGARTNGQARNAKHAADSTPDAAAA
ncbi:MAG: hypothetical protein WBL23_18440, partial [Salinisphaera sp.]|uniref:hypothetical protein n=1 Tax=Salinisphaera sp. TaxID=1914330 RepID=UPI003C7E3672